MELELSADPRRAAVVRFGEDRRRPGPSAFVAPYRGRVLGSVSPDEADRLTLFFDTVLKIVVRSGGRVVAEPQ